MNNNEVQELIDDAAEALADLREPIGELVNTARQSSPDLAGLVSALLYYADQRSFAVLDLLRRGMLWDAEILTRPFMESVLRVMYVCFSPAERRSELIHEYWHGVAAANDLRRSARARVAIEQLHSESTARPVFEAMILSTDQEQRLRDEWPKKQRRDVAQRWSATEIAAELDRELAQKSGISVVQSVLHNYGISSNLIHADEAALSMLKDRADRNPDERHKLECAHLSRILSDLLSYFGLAGLALSHSIEADPGALKAAMDKPLHLFERLEEITEQFYDTQRSFYENRGG